MILIVITLYLVLGLIFGFYFVFKAVNRFDESAQGAPWSFRLLILPGSILLWPVLLKKVYS